MSASSDVEYVPIDTTGRIVRQFPFPRPYPLDLPLDYQELREREPVSVVRIWNGELAWFVARYEDGREALRQSDSLSADTDHPHHPHQGPGTYAQRSRKSFISMDPPEHTRYRQMVAGEFSVTRIERLRPALTASIAEQLERMIDSGPPADLVEEYALPIPTLAIASILGIPYEERELFQDDSRLILSADVSVSEGNAATSRMWDFLLEIVRSKRANPGDDLLSRLAAKISDGLLDEVAAVNTALILLIAGHDTTANQIALSVLTLLQNPAQCEVLREEPERLKSAVEEMLRYINITQTGRRRVATKDMVVVGQLIRAGQAVIIANDSGNRDESAFPNGSTFDIDRDARGHVAFGYGIHQCVGQRLARAELQIAIGLLIRRLRNLQLAVPFSDLSFREGAVIYGLHALPVAW
jgi:cytochrome P450